MGKEQCNQPQQEKPLISGNTKTGFSVNLHDGTTYNFWGPVDHMRKTGIYQNSMAFGVIELLELGLLEGGKERVEEVIYQLGRKQGKGIVTYLNPAPYEDLK